MNESLFVIHIENQSPRQLRRYLNYGKKVKRGEIDDDFCQWLMRIIADNEVYEQKERALAFELAVGESMVDIWETLGQANLVHLFIPGEVDRLTLYLGILNESQSWDERSAYWHLLREEYPKQWSWLRQVHEERITNSTKLFESATGQFFLAYCEQLRSEIGIETSSSGDANREVQRLEGEVKRGVEALKTMEKDLEFAEDRAERAHVRIRKLDEEMGRMRRQLKEERENGNKLRNERKIRISSQRESRQAQKEFEALRREYIKMQDRLRDVAGRLALAEQVRRQPVNRWSLDALRSMDQGELLGVREVLKAEDLSRVRRRFASVLHPDRVQDLPDWIGALFSEIMGIVNKACDRKK